MSRLVELALLDQKPLITGRLFFRDANAPAKLKPGYKMMMVTGVIAVPENFPVEGETHVDVQGFANPDSVELHTQVVGTPVPQVLAMSLDQVLCQPIWRV